MGYCFELKNKLTEEEFIECFELMKNYLVELYGEDSISEENFKIWKANRSEKENRFFIRISKNQETCGYAEIMIMNDDTLYFCDIIINENKRRTRVVYEFVKYVLNLEVLKAFNEIYLHINKKNSTSFNAWSHLGMQEVETGVNSNKYKIERKLVEKFFNRTKEREQ